MSEQDQDHVRISNLERSVGRLEERFDNLELQNRATADDIINKFEVVAKDLHSRISESKTENRKDIESLLGKLEVTRDKYSEGRRVSWTLVATVAIAIWGASIVLVSWGSDQKVQSAVNSVRNEHVANQVEENNGIIQEFRALDKDVDRIDERHNLLTASFSEFEDNYLQETDRVWKSIFDAERNLSSYMKDEIRRNTQKNSTTEAELKNIKRFIERAEKYLVTDIQANAKAEGKIEILEDLVKDRLPLLTSGNQ